MRVYRCRAYPENLDHAGPPRFRAHTETLVEAFDHGILWDVFGINADVQVRNLSIHTIYRLEFTHVSVQPFTSYFPRADIHELLTPDLLHQLIKGTFKDHLVEWVTEYIKLSADSEQEAAEILDQIDTRYALKSSISSPVSS